MNFPGIHRYKTNTFSKKHLQGKSTVLFQNAVKGISNGTFIALLIACRIEMTFNDVMPGMRVFYEVLPHVPGIPSTANFLQAMNFPGIHPLQDESLF